jgi:hypothetical protein
MTPLARRARGLLFHLRAVVRTLLVLLALGALVVVRPLEAQTIADPAARGLDVFVHAPTVAAPGASIPIGVVAVGFTSVVAPSPIARATIEATWNPETLGKAARVPPSVKATTDGDGRAHLDVPMPDGDEADLELLIGVRSGTHARTQKLKVHRARLLDASLFVPDTRVVPGGEISSWVRVESARTGEPAAGVPVHVALLEGGVPRFEVRLVTDAAGGAMTRVPIPRTEDPAWSWKLEAHALAGVHHRGTTAALTLTPREETPGKPRMRVVWNRAAVFAGERAEFRIDVRDATDAPIADLPVRYWIGPKGTEPPKDDAGWLAASTRALTNGMGEVKGTIDTPTTVLQRVGTTMQIVAKTNVDGHDLDGHAGLRVGASDSYAELVPEGRDLVPGVEQRLLLRVHDGHDRPVSGGFVVEGDGLSKEVRTNAWGEAEVTWKPPPDVGAARNVGPCAGGVAASVRVRATSDIPALLPRRDPFDLCLSIDREAAGILRVDRSVARVGDTIHVAVALAQPSPEAKDKVVSRGPWSVLVQSDNGATSMGAWIEDGEKGADIVLPRGAMGAWDISAAMPSTRHAARLLGARILVTPRVLPHLAVRVAGGRVAPGGAVDVEVALTDEKGKPVVGSVAAVMIDANGGGSTAGLEALDTRKALCAHIESGTTRCDAVVEGDPTLDLLRRVALSQGSLHKPLEPEIDPGANVSEKLRKAFAAVLLSLEGAVRDAAKSPDELRDVRRRAAHGWQFNPELMTLVTAAMDPPPETPGGEPLTLGDLMAIDPQVTFDNVARRIARVKMFQILVAVREFRNEHRLDPDEPALKNPNAILRRLVRDGKLGEADLVDPWGGTLQFVKTAGPTVPFLTVVKGFELHSPGPDGAIGTGDDVKDPFERVLRSGTPYALAVQEDRVVDAKFEMEVGDATVEAWKQMFTALFGNTLGDAIGDAFGAGGLGLTGYGSGGGGRGHGVGLTNVRTTHGIDGGVAFWSAPKRTDASGKLTFHVPLRDLETTWRLAVVGFPDGGTPATNAIDIPVALPVSARVDSGAVWVAGDEAQVAVTVKNRTAHAVHANLAFGVGGVAQLAEQGRAGEPVSKAVDVAAEGAAVVRVRVRAMREGTAQLDVRLSAGGNPDDVVNHRWEVRPPGEPTDFTSARWVEDSAELALTLPPASIRIVGAPRLVLERGWDQALAGALGSLEPDEQVSPRALADAIEVASRLQRWAIARGGEKDPLAERAAEVARHAVGRLATYIAIDREAAKVSVARAIPYAPATEVALLGKAAECPDTGGTVDARLEALEAEPEAANGTAKPCWDAFVTDLTETVQSVGTAVELARLVLAVVERPHRQMLAAALAERLRERVVLKPSGAITLADDLRDQRAARATVFAALLRSIRFGKGSVANAERLAAWIGVQRDAQGGYGAPLATRSVVRALLAEGRALGETARVAVESEGAASDVEVAPSAHVVVPLPAGATKVSVRVKGAGVIGVIARFERPVLRLWSHPPVEAASPLHLEAVWPDELKAGKSGTLRLRVRHTLGRSLTADLKVPLPPGVTLAEPVNAVRQVQGVLSIRRTLDGSLAPTVIELPLRFALGGRMTVPEANARVAFEEMARAVAPARPIEVKGP